MNKHIGRRNGRNGALRVLVVGVGNMGASHARAYDKIDGFELAGMCARTIAKRATRATKNADRKRPTRGLIGGAGLLEVQEDDLDRREEHHLRRIVAAFEPAAQARFGNAEVTRELRRAAQDEAGSVQRSRVGRLPRWQCRGTVDLCG